MENIRSKMIINTGGQKNEYDSNKLISDLKDLLKDL